MSTEMFRLIFSGEITQGADISAVKKNVLALLKTDESTVEKLFTARQTTIMNNIDHDTALK